MPTLIASARRFVVVGTLGLGVDLAVFWLLASFSPDRPRSIRACSIAIAFAFTYLANHHWSFAAGGKVPWRRTLRRYAATQSLGLFVSFVVFSVIVSVGSTPSFTTYALLASTAAGAVVNFVGARFFAFSPERPS